MLDEANALNSKVVKYCWLIFHISFISFNQSLQVNGPLDIELVIVGLFTIISQGKQSSCMNINIRDADRSIKCNTNHYVVDIQGASLIAINLCDMCVILKCSY
jgi:hypothetical protein